MHVFHARPDRQHRSARRLRLPFLLLLLLVALFASTSALAQGSAQSSVATSWRLLDYIAVDYREAIRDGQVINAEEYAEMVEFSASARARIAALEAGPARAQLERKARALEVSIEQKASPETVADQARRLAADLIAAYPVPLAPSGTIDLDRAKRLYQAECASCHGRTGDADGPLSPGMEPPPIAFTDPVRAADRSLFALYQVITQGLEDTPMLAFDHLPEQDRWALAFHIGAMAFDPETIEAGRRLWQSRPELRPEVDLERLIGSTPADFRAAFGEEEGTALIAFLRSSPEALAASGSESLAETRARIAAALRAFSAGERRLAQDLAVAAYLDGFEPIEPQLAVRDSDLVRRIEGAMAAFRAAISADAPAAEVEASAQAVLVLVDEAETRLGEEEGSWWASFLGALAVLLREGLEALLLVAAFIALLRKSERTDLLPYVHGGWVSAILAGGLTWLLATTLITISGAARELVEGFGALTAAIVLVWVGIWMHGRSRGNAWQDALKERMGRALSGNSVWYLFGLVFLVVYREAFETILFYIALIQQGNGFAILLGGLTAIALLVVIGYALLKASGKLPIRTFFAWSSYLMAALAVVLAGKGVAALQEAGWIPINPLGAGPRLPVLGVYPTIEGLVTQALVLALLIAMFLVQRRTAGRPAESQ